MSVRRSGFERRTSAGASRAGRGGGVIELVVKIVIVGSVTFLVVVLVNWLTDPDPGT
jgi:hypothetical protein